MRLDHVVDDWFMAKRCKACENILKPSSAMFLRCGMKVNKVLVVSFGSTSSSSSSSFEVKATVVEQFDVVPL